MKNSLHTAGVSIALVSAALGLAGSAGAAPATVTSVGTTISKLAAKGYRVVVHRVGSAPLEQCTVSQVRPGQTFTSIGPGGGDGVTTVTSKTVYLDVIC